MFGVSIPLARHEVAVYRRSCPAGNLFMIVRTVEQVRRISRIGFGFTALLAGIVMIVTPGPGWLVILLAWASSLPEFVWARRLMDRIKREGGRVRRRLGAAQNGHAGKRAETNRTVSFHHVRSFRRLTSGFSSSFFEPEFEISHPSPLGGHRGSRKIIGLGNMGTGMAKSLLRAGHKVTAYNRTRSKAEALASSGATIAATIADACRTGIVITMLAEDVALESTVFGNHGVLASLPRGGLHISSSTISVALSDKLADAHARAGQSFVSAPVCRPEAAEATTFDRRCRRKIRRRPLQAPFRSSRSKTDGHRRKAVASQYGKTRRQFHDRHGARNP